MAKKAKKVTGEQKEKIRALLLSTDKSNRQIAREIGVSESTVRRIRAEEPEEEITQAHLDRKVEFANKAWDSIDKALEFANQRIKLATVGADQFEPLLNRLIELLEKGDGVNGQDIKEILVAFAGILNIPLNHVSTYIGTIYDKRALAEGEPTGHQKVSGQVTEKYVYEITQKVLTDPDAREQARELFRRAASRDLEG
ncbi:MAG: helix-turn-helix domain-containing protein [Firmicutes bacterium]|nr:helix-turn-helix domain-containing protein [Bacillota bacterium]